MMLSRRSLSHLTLVVATLGFACWASIGNGSSQNPPPTEAREVFLSDNLREAEPTLQSQTVAPHAKYFALKASRTPGGLACRSKSGSRVGAAHPWKAYALGMVLRGLEVSGVVAAESAVVIPAGVVKYTVGGVQPMTEVSWSVLGLADSEEEGGEGAIVEYGG